MTFADATTTNRGTIRCSVGAFLRELSDKDADEAQLFAERWLMAKDHRGWAVADTLIHAKIGDESNLHGYETTVSKRQINPHRRGDCSCTDADAS